MSYRSSIVMRKTSTMLERIGWSLTGRGRVVFIPISKALRCFWRLSLYHYARYFPKDFSIQQTKGNIPCLSSFQGEKDTIHCDFIKIHKYNWHVFNVLLQLWKTWTNYCPVSEGAVSLRPSKKPQAQFCRHIYLPSSNLLVMLCLSNLLVFLSQCK